MMNLAPRITNSKNDNNINSAIDTYCLKSSNGMLPIIIIINDNNDSDGCRGATISYHSENNNPNLTHFC